MGSRLTLYFIRKEKCDPDNPKSRMDIDLKYSEKIMCHNDKAIKARYNVYEAYGLIFGTLLIPFTPKRWHAIWRMSPFYTLVVAGIIMDMRTLENTCTNELKLCNQVIKAHKLMVTAGHPPLAPVDRWIDNGPDPWQHLRNPPLILKRNLIENWKYNFITLPQLDENEKELIHQTLTNKRF